MKFEIKDKVIVEVPPTASYADIEDTTEKIIKWFPEAEGKIFNYIMTGENISHT